MLSVRFVRMWKGFKPEDNPLLPVLRQALSADLEIRRDSRSPVDIEVASVYPSARTKYVNLARTAGSRVAGSQVDSRMRFVDPPKSRNARLGIWYTPENVRPPAAGWDVTLSFEPTGWTPTNAYLPFWQLGTDLFGGSFTGFLGRTLGIAEMTQRRPSTTALRKGFCCTFIRNPHPVRMRAIEALRAVGPVDVFGLAGGRPVGNKLQVARNYRFMLCFENDLYPGYVTEKVFDAWAVGAVPLWWGLDHSGSLNTSALINLSDEKSLDAFCRRVKECNAEPSVVNSMAGAPILRSVQSDRDVCATIRRAWERVGD